MALTDASYVFRLEGHVPSKKNSKRWLKRGKRVFSVPSLSHEVWHEVQMLAVRPYVQRDPFLSKGPIEKVERMKISFRAGDMHRNDLTNKAESVMDLLVDAGILKDDSWFIVPDLQLTFLGVDKTRFVGAIVEIWL